MRCDGLFIFLTGALVELAPRASKANRMHATYLPEPSHPNLRVSFTASHVRLLVETGFNDEEVLHFPKATALRLWLVTCVHQLKQYYTHG